MKQDEMDGISGAHRIEWWENLDVKDYLEDLGVDGEMILN
jgi:hypothetical protein